MAKKPNIVSFDDARTRSRRESGARSQRTSRESGQEGSERARSAGQRRGSRQSRSASAPRIAARSNERASENASMRSGSRATARASRGAAAASAKRPSWLQEMMPSRSEADYADSRGNARGDDSRKRSGLLASWQNESRSANGEDSAAASRGRKQSQSSKRRARTKARADRQFAKQYGDAADFPESAEGAPRAAVYEGQMGAKHRRSARMQRASQAGPSSVKASAAGLLSALPFTARTVRLGTAVLCVFLFCALLYGPAQQYYQAQREHDRLVVEYSAIESRNNALDEQNDILASDAGMEDAVRQKFGYVKAGEEVAYVAGLSDEASEARRDSDNLHANVMSSTVKAPDAWYTPLLDTFFGVE